MVFALNFGLNAQTYKGEEIIVGVKGGVALSSGSFVEPNNSRPEQNACYHHLGGFGGLAFRYSGEKYLAVQVEANFMQRGWRSYNDFSRTFNYVEIPLLAHAFYGAKGFRWFVNFGPEISFLVNESQWGAADTVYMSEPVKSRFDYGLLVGTGFEIHTKAGIYQLEGRYEFGFGDVFSALPSDTFRRSANRNITLTFGILFNLKKYK
ncbi:MAG: PorT family protein [Prevotellaceae bacterium]|nr:PorT family protein [Prevotellaceae bacterium]